MPAIHPDVAALIALGRAAGSLPFEAMSPLEARRAYADRRLLLQLPPDAVAECRNLTIEGPGGPLRLRLYRGAGTGSEEILPCLLYLHGGGWVLGDLDSHDGICCRLANEAGCCVVAVDYRLAPEHPFPAALDDAVASLCWLSREAISVRIDPARIAVGGDSAGGNLAAVLALMGRDGTVPASVFQVLLYPALDMTMSSASYAETTDGMTITPATMRYFIDHYVPHSDDRTDWRASPLHAASVRGAPPAFLLTCGHDPLCDEGSLYASRLEQEDVPVTALHLSDQTHGMLTLSKAIGAFQRTLAYAAATLIDGWGTAPSRILVTRRV